MAAILVMIGGVFESHEWTSLTPIIGFDIWRGGPISVIRQLHHSQAADQERSSIPYSRIPGGDFAPFRTCIPSCAIRVYYPRLRAIRAWKQVVGREPTWPKKIRFQTKCRSASA